MSEKLAFKVAEFAEAIGVSRSQAYELVASGQVPSVRVGKKGRRIPVEAAKAWIRDNVTGGTVQAGGR